MKISGRRLADYVKTLHQKACRTCSTIIFLHWTNQIIDLWRCRWRCRRQILSSLLMKVLHVQPQGHKSIIWLIEWGTIIVLHVQHALKNIFFRSKNFNLWLCGWQRKPAAVDFSYVLIWPLKINTKQRQSLWLDALAVRLTFFWPGYHWYCGLVFEDNPISDISFLFSSKNPNNADFFLSDLGF